MPSRRFWGLTTRRSRERETRDPAPIWRPLGWGRLMAGTPDAEEEAQRGHEGGSRRGWGMGPFTGTSGGSKARRPPCRSTCLACGHPWGSQRWGGWGQVRGPEAHAGPALGPESSRPLIPSRHQCSHPHFRGRRQESGHRSGAGYSSPQLHLHSACPGAGLRAWVSSVTHFPGAHFTEGETKANSRMRVGDIVIWLLLTPLPRGTGSPGPGL